VRADVQWIDLARGQEDVVARLVASPHTRLLVGDGDLDSLRGVVQSRDVLADLLQGKPLQLEGNLREPQYVLSSASALQALELIRQHPVPLAVAVDEYGSVEGLVTANDLLAAIAGDLVDTQDERYGVVAQGEDQWEADGALTLDDLQRLGGRIAAAQCRLHDHLRPGAGAAGAPAGHRRRGGGGRRAHHRTGDGEAPYRPPAGGAPGAWPADCSVERAARARSSHARLLPSSRAWAWLYTTRRQPSPWRARFLSWMVAVLSTIGLLMGLYVAWRLFWPLRMPTGLKVVLSLLLVAVPCSCASWPPSGARWHRRKSRSWPSPAGHRLHGGAAAGVADAGAGCRPAAFAPAALAAHRIGPARPKLRPLAGLLALLVSGYGVSQGMAVPQPRQIDVAIKDLPAAFDGYRVLQLTDIHASRLLTGDWVRRVVDESNALKPDLIVITGDLIDGSVEARRDDAPVGRSAGAGRRHCHHRQPRVLRAVPGNGCRRSARCTCRCWRTATCRCGAAMRR
jgi:disulfide bond formation protein DsbB/CBS domain-containing protein